MTPRQPYILWLASWYPSADAPFLGDFIQRHARAAAQFVPITVVHLVPCGHRKPVAQQTMVRTDSKELTEIVVYPRFIPWGWASADRLRYNWIFYRTGKKILKQYLAEKGLPQGVHVQVPMKAGILARWLKSTRHIPYILTEHASAYVPEIADNYSRRHGWYRWQVRNIYRDAVAVHTVSAFMASVLRPLFGLPCVQVIPNVVATGVFYHTPNNKPAKVFRFLHVSGMESVKNPLGILQAFAQCRQHLPDAELVFVGPESALLVAAAHDLGVGAWVQFRGMIPYEDVAREMKQADALVVFSYMESFSCVTAEALCCGLPVIASKAGALPELIHPANGLLVAPGDTRALAAAMMALVQHYPAFDRHSIAAQAQQCYAEEVVGRQIFNAYQSFYTAGIKPY